MCKVYDSSCGQGPNSLGSVSAEGLRMKLCWSRCTGTDLHTWWLSTGIWICSNETEVSERSQWRWGFLCTDPQSVGCSLHYQGWHYLVLTVFLLEASGVFWAVAWCPVMSLISNFLKTAGDLMHPYHSYYWDWSCLSWFCDPGLETRRDGPLEQGAVPVRRGQLFPGSQPALEWWDMRHFLHYLWMLFPNPFPLCVFCYVPPATLLDTVDRGSPCMSCSPAQYYWICIYH